MELAGRRMTFLFDPAALRCFFSAPAELIAFRCRHLALKPPAKQALFHHMTTWERQLHSVCAGDTCYISGCGARIKLGSPMLLNRKDNTVHAEALHKGESQLDCRPHSRRCLQGIVQESSAHVGATCNSAAYVVAFKIIREQHKYLKVC